MAQNEVVLDGELSLDMMMDGDAQLDLSEDGEVGMMSLIKVGIIKIIFNPDYTITFVMSDGSRYTSGVIRGEKGDKGDQGIQGEKGDRGDVGPVGPHGEQGIQGIQGNKGDKGDKGDTGSQGIQGIQGDKGDTGNSGVYVGETEPEDDEVNVWIDSNGDPDAIVEDVQINGTSIVQDGVANIPIVNSREQVGGMVAKTPLWSGITFTDTGAYLTLAANALIKAGTDNSRTSLINQQHLATFYGLAKAAGHQAVSENSILALGTVQRRYGKGLRLSGNGIEASGIGYFSVDASVSIAPTAAGTVTVAMFKNGVQVPGAIAYGSTTTAGNPVAMSIVSTIRRGCCCDGADNLTFVVLEGAGTAKNVSVRIVEE